jgi:hypothetical protein
VIWNVASYISEKVSYIPLDLPAEKTQTSVNISYKLHATVCLCYYLTCVKLVRD